jgi:hypothetical protein
MAASGSAFVSRCASAALCRAVGWLRPRPPKRLGSFRFGCAVREAQSPKISRAAAGTELPNRAEASCFVSHVDLDQT